MTPPVSTCHSSAVIVTLALLLVASPLERALEGAARVDRVALTRALIALQNPGSRVTGTPGEVEARAFIVRSLNALGADVEQQPIKLRQIFEPGLVVDTENIIAHFGPPRSPRIVVLAHLDSKAAQDFADAQKRGWSWSSGLAPGADDNASGCVALLELARLLVASPPSTGVDLVWTAGEELAEIDRDAWMSNLGAELLADKYLRDGVEISGAIAVDMLLKAQPSEMVLRVYSDGRLGSETFTTALIHGAAVVAPEVRIIERIDPSFTYSDHGSFWARGWPGVLLIEDDFHHPRYHTEKDRLIVGENFYSLDQLVAATKILWAALAFQAG